jgi:hypothetical protein
VHARTTKPVGGTVAPSPGVGCGLSGSVGNKIPGKASSQRVKISRDGRTNNHNQLRRARTSTRIGYRQRDHVGTWPSIRMGSRCARIVWRGIAPRPSIGYTRCTAGVAHLNGIGNARREVGNSGNGWAIGGGENKGSNPTRYIASCSTAVSVVNVVNGIRGQSRKYIRRINIRDFGGHRWKKSRQTNGNIRKGCILGKG